MKCRMDGCTREGTKSSKGIIHAPDLRDEPMCVELPLCPEHYREFDPGKCYEAKFVIEGD